MVAQAKVNVERVRGNLWHVGSECVVLTSTGATFCTCPRGRAGWPCEHARAVRQAWAGELQEQARRLTAE